MGGGGGGGGRELNEPGIWQAEVRTADFVAVVMPETKHLCPSDDLSRLCPPRTVHYPRETGAQRKPYGSHGNFYE